MNVVSLEINDGPRSDIQSLSMGMSERQLIVIYIHNPLNAVVTLSRHILIYDGTLRVKVN
jgi:hypothetical protein